MDVSTNRPNTPNDNNTQPLNANTESDTCSICLCGYNTVKVIDEKEVKVEVNKVTTNCGHAFHEHCLKPAFTAEVERTRLNQRTITCPI